MSTKKSLIPTTGSSDIKSKLLKSPFIASNEEISSTLKYLKHRENMINLSEQAPETSTSPLYIPVFTTENSVRSTKNSLKSILHHLKLTEENQHEGFKRIIKHLKEHAFGHHNRYTNDSSFIESVETIMPRFYSTICLHSYDDVKIQDGRIYVNSVLGRKKKVIKKRKSMIDMSEKEEEDRDNEQRLFFDAIFFLMFCIMKSKDLEPYYYTDKQFMTVYGDLCHSITDEDKDTVVLYRNMMKLAMCIISPSGNKGHLLDLITRIVEGSHKKYITGSGATIDTKRRVRIYETEGGISVAIRPERRKVKEAKMLGSLISLHPMENQSKSHSNTNAHATSPSIITPEKKSNSSTVVVSPLIKSSGAEREAAESIASLHSVVLNNDLKLEESQDSVMWTQAITKFSAETPLNRNHSLI